MNKQQTEPVNVAKFWDDLLLGVKGLSSLVIAGSPRNLSQQSGIKSLSGNVKYDSREA